MTITEYTALDAFVSVPRVKTFSHGSEGNEVLVLSEIGVAKGKSPLSVSADEKVPESSLHLLGRTAWTYDHIYCASLPRGKIVAGVAPTSANDEFFYDLSIHGGRHVLHPAVTTHPDGRRTASIRSNSKRTISKSAALLFFSGASGLHHSHWLLQTLPKVQWFKDAGVNPDIFLVHDTIQPYQRATLNALGISNDQIEIISRDEEVQFSHLYALYTTTEMTPDIRIFDQLIAEVEPDHSGPEKIYVSRQDARRTRRFINESQVIEVVKKHGYEVIIPSQLSFEDEIRKFRNARIILGPVGAGLYNALFTQSGAHIIALSEPAYVMDWPLQLASLRNHEISYILGNSFLSEDPVHHGTHNSWVLDAAYLESVLEQVKY